MSDKPTRGVPHYTVCTEAHGELANSDGVTRHTAFIQLLGECRICKATELFQGPREALVERVAHEALETHVVIEVDDVEVWDVDDLFYRDIDEVVTWEIPRHVSTDAIDRTLEGLRVMRQGLKRAIVQIDRELAIFEED